MVKYFPSHTKSSLKIIIGRKTLQNIILVRERLFPFPDFLPILTLTTFWFRVMLIFMKPFFCIGKRRRPAVAGMPLVKNPLGVFSHLLCHCICNRTSSEPSPTYRINNSYNSCFSSDICNLSPHRFKDSEKMVIRSSVLKFLQKLFPIGFLK